MHEVTPSAADALGRSFLGGPGGLGAWYQTKDHKRIALMFLGWTAGAFLVAMMQAILPLVKTLGGPGLGTRLLLETITYQRLLQVTGWLIPVVPAVLGYFLLPLQLGADNMSFPGISRWSLRFYLVGLLLILVSLMVCPVGTGWTMDAHLSMLDPGALSILLVALFCMSVSWFLIGVNILVTVHHGRRDGMGFFDMPLASWGFYLYSYLMVFSGAVFGVLVLYMMASRLSTEGMFGWQSDPMTWRTYFWFAIRPVAFFSVIPAVGVVSDVISGMARKASAGYRTMVGAMIALTGLAVVSYGAGLVGQGLSPAGSVVFSAMSLLVAVPVALISFIWLSTIFRGSVSCGAPSTYSIAFIFHAGIAAILGLFLASPSLGAFLGATMFASTQLDYIIWGTATSALFAGLHFWWPKMMGRPYSDEVARIGAILYIIGLNLALIPRLMMGTRGVPQDFAGLVEGSLPLAEVSSLGWLIVYSGLGVAAFNLLATIKGDKVAEENPWGARSLEWTVSSPPPEDNFS